MKILVLGYSFDDTTISQAILETLERKGSSAELLELSTFSIKDSASGRYKRVLNKTLEKLRGAHRTVADEAFAHALYGYIVQNGYFSVICTDSISIKAVGAMKRYDRLSIPCYGMLTDYTSVPTLSEFSLDGYFIAHEEMMDELMKNGIKSERMIATGVPLSSRFFSRRSKEDARNYLVIPQNKRVYLFMSGGVSFENLKGMCDELLRTERGDFIAFVTLKRGDERKEKLEEYYRGNEHIRLVTFSKKFKIYMECADVVISKPDAALSFEAAATGVPLVHIMTLRESNSKTAEFFSSKEMSLKAVEISDAVQKAKRLVEEKAIAARMIQRQYRNTKTDAAEKIAETVMQPKRGRT